MGMPCGWDSGLLEVTFALFICGTARDRWANPFTTRAIVQAANRKRKVLAETLSRTALIRRCTASC